MSIPGESPFPPLSPERVEAARATHGDAVDRYLAYLRLGDPLADDLVAWFEQGPPGAGFRLLLQAIHDGIGSVEDPPAPLVALFVEVDHVPPWVDWDLMRLASGRILRGGLLTALSLATYALPHCYLATANRPLAATGRLLDATAHRYAQTTRFVIESFMPGGLKRQADGFKLAILVRLMHARVRRRLLRSGDWTPVTGEVPVNQAHTALNLVFFSFYVLRGLERLGMRFTAREEEGVLMTWRYVGHLFGVDPAFVYTSAEEARGLVDLAFSLEFDPDETSRRLCRAMVEAGPTYMNIADERLARMFVRLIHPVSRHLLGDRLADRLGYAPARHRLVCGALVALVRLSEWSPRLVPRALRNFVGVNFWLEASNYDLGTLVGEAEER